jgi:type II secretory pathway pseudopilin PulG
MLKKAFTYGELLLTLSIIGIVAIFSMPALQQNYKDKIFEVGMLTSQNRLSEALAQMSANDQLKGYSSTSDFVDALKKYLNIKGEVADYLNVSLANAKFDGIDDWGTEQMGIRFENGQEMLVKYNPNCTAGIGSSTKDQQNCIAFAYDINGSNGPNIYGKDIQGHRLTTTGGLSNILAEQVAENTFMLRNAFGDPISANWKDAKNLCESKGLRLPSVSIQEEFEDFKCLINATHDSVAIEACVVVESCLKVTAASGTASNACPTKFWLAESAGSSPGGCNGPKHYAYHLNGTYTNSALINRNNQAYPSGVMCVGGEDYHPADIPSEPEKQYIDR